MQSTNYQTAATNYQTCFSRTIDFPRKSFCYKLSNFFSVIHRELCITHRIQTIKLIYKVLEEERNKVLHNLLHQIRA